jgi:predicted glycosyltransferase
MVGIGHMHRNLRIAQTLVQSPLQPTILMIAEAREANVLTMPAGGDCLTLPALCKEYDGQCHPRYLNVPLDTAKRLRASVISAALEAFPPDVLIVDHLPRGALGELNIPLEDLRARGHTRCVLGLRDVLEHPDRVRAEWAHAANEDAIRDYFDAVWIYGDPAVYDPVQEYHFSREVAAKVRYTGYLDYQRRPDLAENESAELLATLPKPSERLLLCMVGGGQDGAHLAEAFAQVDFPAGTCGVILMGPFMPDDAQRRLRRQAAHKANLRVLGFVSDPYLLLSRAERVVAMGGYNTIYEVLSFEKPALIVPRSKPRHEQRIRAERLRQLGLLEVLPPENVNPEVLGRWLQRELGPAPRVRERIDLNGTSRLPQFLQDLLEAAPHPGWKASLDLEIQHVTH